MLLNIAPLQTGVLKPVFNTSYIVQVYSSGPEGASPTSTRNPSRSFNIEDNSSYVLIILNIK